MQKEGYKCLTGLGRGKHCKKNGEKQQKIDGKPCPIRRERERKVWKTFEKWVWTS